MFTILCQYCKKPIVVEKYPSNGQETCLICHQINKLEPEKKYAPKLVMIQGQEKGQEFILEGPTSLGRGSSNTIHLNEPKASRKHAVIEHTHGQYIIQDLQSGNGTFVNDKLVGQMELQDKDLVQIADAVFMFRNPYHYTSSEVEQPLPTISQPDIPKPAQEALVTENISNFHRTQAEVKFNAQHSFLMSAEELRNITNLEKANNKLRILYQVNHAISSILNLQELLGVILDVVFQYIPAERGAILLYNPDTKELKSAVTKIRHSDDQPKDNAEAIKISRTILDRVVTERVSLLSTDTLVDERLAEAMSIFSQGIRSSMSVPLICKDDFLGVLHIDSTRKSEEFNQDNLELLTGIAGQAAIAIENAKLIKEIEREVETRGHLQRYLSPELVDQVVNKQINFEIGGQLKKATVLFSDLRGFTKMTEKIGAEAVVAILNDYFSRMVDIIFATGGTLDKFIGDAIMAIWGLPVSHAEDSIRSVKASLLMQEELFYFNIFQKKMSRSILKMGIGINVGQVVVGNMGSPKRMEYTVIGPPVNLASRVESLTGRNQILLSDNLYSEVKNLVYVVELQATRVKGIDRLIQIYDVIGIHDHQENRDILFLPILVLNANQPEQKYEGLLTFCDLKSARLHIEPTAEIQPDQAIQFIIDIPDVAPEEPLHLVSQRVDKLIHNSDDYIAVEGRLTKIPSSVQTFFHRVFPAQNFETTITGDIEGI